MREREILERSWVDSRFSKTAVVRFVQIALCVSCLHHICYSMFRFLEVAALAAGGGARGRGALEAKRASGLSAGRSSGGCS